MIARAAEPELLLSDRTASEEDLLPETRTVTAERKERVDKYLSSVTELTRSRIQHLIEDGNITVNDTPVKTNHVVVPGDVICILLPPPKAVEAVPEELPLDIVYEDPDVCVINKPQGLVVHPAPGHERGTLVNGLLYHFAELSSIGGELRPGIVHRIDRDTSGLLVVAKNDAAHLCLSEQFRDHTAYRRYLTIVDGNLKEDSGTIDADIGRHPTDRKRMAVVSCGRHAVTHWKVLRRFSSHTLLEARLETGRTHQIRVHLSSVHHPVAGDGIYGSEKNGLGLKGQALHGYYLSFIHPSSKERVSFTAELPPYFTDALRKLRCNEQTLRSFGLPEEDL